MEDNSNFAPYAPKKAVLGVIRRYRDTGLPEPLTLTGLASVGIPSSTTSRTLQTLRFLGLVDEGGNLLEVAQRLKRASTAEYPEALAEIIRAAYLAVFAIVDPAKHDAIAIADAFRQYEPSKQRDKMIVLFLALCEEAGIVDARQPKQRTAGTRTQRPAKPRLAQKITRPRQRENVQRRDEDEALPDYRLIAAIIQQLPRDKRWTIEKRETWMSIMGSAVDLLIDVTDRDGYRGGAA